MAWHGIREVRKGYEQGKGYEEGKGSSKGFKGTILAARPFDVQKHGLHVCFLDLAEPRRNTTLSLRLGLGLGLGLG